MKQFTTTIIIIFILVGCQVKNSSRFDDAVKKSSAFVEKFMEEQKVPGMSISVSYKDSLIWSQGFGYADVENKVPATTNSKFRCASISKLYATVLTARLAEDGIIDLDKPVTDILKDYPRKKWGFTIRHIESHTSGIRTYADKDTKLHHLHNSIENGIKIFQDDPLLFIPGTGYQYSTYAFVVLSACLQEVTGTPYFQLLKDTLLTKLDMNNTYLDDPLAIIPERAGTYSLDSVGNLIHAPYSDNRYKAAGGGIFTSTEDMIKFGEAVMFTNYVNDDTRKMFFTPYQYGEHFRNDRGFGWRIIKDDNDNLIYGHLGGQDGGSAVLAIYPKYDLIIAWTGNLNSKWKYDKVEQVGNYFIDVIEKVK